MPSHRASRERPSRPGGPPGVSCGGREARLLLVLFVAATAAAAAPLAGQEAREAREAVEAQEARDALEAVRAEAIDPAAALRERARRADAHRHAPIAFGEGEEALRRARLLVEAPAPGQPPAADVPPDPGARAAEARALAEEAAAAFRRALRVAPVADSLRRDRLTLEEVLWRQQAEAARLGPPLGFEADPGAGVGPAVDRAIEAARALQEERRRLRAELAGARDALDTAAVRIDTLEARLARLEERHGEVAERLAERERRERRLREVRAIFTEEEGEVLLAGDRLVLRLTGLVFPTGEAEVLPDHRSLLTKVQRVLREFPDAPVTVEGHTDSRGDAGANRGLSQRRAIAVREYLLAAMPISSGRISAVGHGADRPVATNATEEGRARNRRIEVVLEVGGAL